MKAVANSAAGEVAVKHTANRALHQQVALAVGRNALGVVDLVEDRHEQVAEIVQCQHRNLDVARDHRHLGQAVRVSALRIGTNPDDGIVERCSSAVSVGSVSNW